MGRVRTKTIKRAARQIVEKYYAKLTLDFQINKKITEEVAIIPSKRMKNKVAGFVTHLMKRIQKGPVRGISLKLQEEERERRLDFVPEKSQIDVNVIYVEPDTVRMIKSLGINISNMKVHNPMINSNQQKQNRMNNQQKDARKRKRKGIIRCREKVARKGKCKPLQIEKVGLIKL
ncbi:40S ribosomal protein S17, putative [Plasmodium ovale curtisi]|uniref:40S ribosomal protein S17, putative n=1 Tax=Plasmodium ovale curtisi TaxID=864141 RepID=A0A1A8WAW7_PLAOA|nr:40S ribosomal protein S17, putative [Plasmodium ovale curtisi]SBS98593.1 40S ribosomal protein S17, putative [Plasmodium ovale curtisi]